MLTFLSMCHDIIYAVFSHNSPGGAFFFFQSHVSMRTMERNQIWFFYENHSYSLVNKVSVALCTLENRRRLFPRVGRATHSLPWTSTPTPAALLLLCPYFHKAYLPKLPKSQVRSVLLPLQETFIWSVHDYPAEPCNCTAMKSPSCTAHESTPAQHSALQTGHQGCLLK